MTREQQALTTATTRGFRILAPESWPSLQRRASAGPTTSRSSAPPSAEASVVGAVAAYSKGCRLIRS
jgi:hypothetical protein